MKKGSKLYELFWLFIIASIVGWIIECIFTLVTTGNYQNHSAVVVGYFDMALTVVAVNRAKAYNKGITASNRFEEFLDHTYNDAYLGNMYGYGWSHQK